MARKASPGKKAKKSERAAGRKGGRSKPKARKAVRLQTPDATLALVNAGMHDFTNLATAVRAYLELLTSQGALAEKQQYYVTRAREQVEMMVDLMAELKEKLN